MDAANRVLETAELISTVFSFFKQEKGKWKGPISRLALVNRSFFHASILVVWEDMDSFEPFASVLVPGKALVRSYFRISLWLHYPQDCFRLRLRLSTKKLGTASIFIRRGRKR